MKLGNIETSAETPFGDVSLGDPVGSLSKIAVGVGMFAGGAALGVAIYKTAKGSFESATGIDTGEGFVPEV